MNNNFNKYPNQNNSNNNLNNNQPPKNAPANIPNKQNAFTPVQHNRPISPVNPAGNQTPNRNFYVYNSTNPKLNTNNLNCNQRTPPYPNYNINQSVNYQQNNINTSSNYTKSPDQNIDDDPKTQTISSLPVSGYQNPARNNPPDIRMYNRQKNYRVQPAEKPEKKALKNLFNLLIILLLIFTILISTVFIGIYSLCAKTNYIEDNLNPQENFFEMLFSNDDLFNVLLIGTDDENDDISRSDTIMLISINKATEKIKLTSFMRDTWVTIPGHGEGRLNASYARGGAELLIKTINLNFNLDISNYVLVDFKMFEELIDALGGVSVEITEKEAEFINNTTSVKVESGINNLNGKEALVYCRIRKLDSDFMRTKRQRKVISAIIEKAKSQDITTIFKGTTEVLPLIQTNISPTKMTVKSITVVTALDYSVEQLRVPVDDSFKEEKINGQQVIVPDLDVNIKEINEFINN